MLKLICTQPAELAILAQVLAKALSELPPIELQPAHASLEYNDQGNLCGITVELDGE